MLIMAGESEESRLTSNFQEKLTNLKLGWGEEIYYAVVTTLKELFCSNLL
ncbi:hypothetical protein ES288_A07G166200v1 [Gossypium darwinii]|uniref:Factor of DNA methylation 1-5/IDN2 domain-containing protein n=1 Tax=Gossypium darwinii TaxID=34276 RepID=A0A5D2FXU3_GOSDA|nr:hypothetical protein ES288_A07G166200v1 [Gossypium darwinii]